MHKLLAVGLLSIALITIVSSQLGYNTPSAPSIDRPILTSTDGTSNNTVNVNNSNCWQSICSTTGLNYILNSTTPHNGTGSYNVISNTGYPIPHQVYNLTQVVAFNTQYNNTLDRPLMIAVSGLATVALINDAAFITLKSGTSVAQDIQSIGCIKLITASIGVQPYCNMQMTVPPGYVWTINGTLAGTGTIKIEQVWATVL